MSPEGRNRTDERRNMNKVSLLVVAIIATAAVFLFAVDRPPGGIGAQKREAAEEAAPAAEASGNTGQEAEGEALHLVVA